MLILQAFYWNCLDDWWNEISSITEEISIKGFDTVWLPPPSKGMNGKNSMGYDIKEHYNLESKFGNKRTLKRLIKQLHKNKVEVMADLVLGHMLGGKKEWNPHFERKTYTKFEEKEFPKNHLHFCHECGGCSSRNSFGETICYYSDQEYMKDELINWASWLKKEIGFDSFRLDNLKDMRWDFAKEFADQFRDNTFMVGEYWNGDDRILQEFIDHSQINLFNFPLYYSIKEMCMDPFFPMQSLEGISKKNKVNFLSNHDIEREERDFNKDAIITNKELGYAYILFQDNPAVIYWNDYFKYDLKEKLDQLINLRKNSSHKQLEIVTLNDDIYHAKRGRYNLIINNGYDEYYYSTLKVNGRDYEIFIED
ncbi:Alpha amylase, catalytic domain [Halanaerobium congolense]|uniref:Alpha amylase, catalytic domain n=1 Tax=Halanaerobium congolense TaxID=54121 RepID=A0A1I0AH40_9FIRM|nr:alpha-amylase family glycosyl hydrolase [Halanaerobium congolense]PTX17424.1 alpha-amylase [Halanaerobium congolense]SDF43824.1 Alpha amylase, catalytic domain [Halanaerobium congolense]SES93490.1 Alpha amylase, catalytic domain [Halanaerobium congolense]SFP25484.1 Alpha amylase, catalytic domain [Halanaerobium congolense]